MSIRKKFGNLSSSSSSCRSVSTDIPDPLSPLLPIVYHLWQVFRATFHRPAFAWPYSGVHRSTSLMSLSLLLRQCLACLFRLTWIVFMMGGRWQYSCCSVGCIHLVYIYIYIQNLTDEFHYKYISIDLLCEGISGFMEFLPFSLFKE